MTASTSTTCSSRPSPSEQAKQANLPAANKSAFARAGPGGAATVTTRRQKASASGGSDRGVQLAITSAADGVAIGQ